MPDDLRERLNRMPTTELVEVLRSHDLEQWRPEVFPVVEALLKERGIDVDAVTVRDDAPIDEADHEQLLSVASFATALDANLCRMALQEATIDAWLSTEHLAGVAPPLGVAIGVDVLVRPAAVAAAREVLASIETGAAALAEEAEICPNCASTDTIHIQAKDRASAVSGWFMVGLPLPQNVWRWKCNSCENEWV